MFHVYILRSQSGVKTYTGCTNNLERRLSEHNLGKVKSSRPYKPYLLVYSEEFVDLKQARSRERFLKSTSGRREIKEILSKFESKSKVVGSQRNLGM